MIKKHNFYMVISENKVVLITTNKNKAYMHNARLLYHGVSSRILG